MKVYLNHPEFWNELDEDDVTKINAATYACRECHGKSKYHGRGLLNREQLIHIRNLIFDYLLDIVSTSDLTLTHLGHIISRLKPIITKDVYDKIKWIIVHDVHLICYTIKKLWGINIHPVKALHLSSHLGHSDNCMVFDAVADLKVQQASDEYKKSSKYGDIMKRLDGLQNYYETMMDLKYDIHTPVDKIEVNEEIWKPLQELELEHKLWSKIWAKWKKKQQNAKSL